MPSVIGLDLSLTSTGISMEDQTEALRASHTGMERLRWVRENILERVQKFDQPVVCIEGYAFSARNSQAHAIGELGGVVRLALFERNIPFVEIPPTSRAKFASGRGNASKSEVVSAVSARTGIVWSGSGADDCCDAWILREMGLCFLGDSTFDWPKTNLDALTKIDWAPLSMYTQSKSTVE